MLNPKVFEVLEREVNNRDYLTIGELVGILEGLNIQTDLSFDELENGLLRDLKKLDKAGIEYESGRFRKIRPSIRQKNTKSILEMIRGVLGDNARSAANREIKEPSEPVLRSVKPESKTSRVSAEPALGIPPVEHYPTTELRVSADAAKLVKRLQKHRGKAGNRSLRSELRWSREKYSMITKELLLRGYLDKGKGRGGSVRFKFDAYVFAPVVVEGGDVIKPEVTKPVGKNGVNPTKLTRQEIKVEIQGPTSDGLVDEDADPTIAQFEPNTWESIAVDRLCELLDRKTIESAVGEELLLLVRSNIRRKTGQDRHGSKLELATVLMRSYGRDLFFAKTIVEVKGAGQLGLFIRNAVSKTLKVEGPRRFFPGKASAIKFVQECGFPEEMAGEASESSREPIKTIEARASLSSLQSYQSDILNQVIDVLNREKSRSAMVSLPTGAGKTRTAVESIHRWMKMTAELHGHFRLCNLVVWVAQTDELCEQAFEEFEDVWIAEAQSVPTKLVRLWGGICGTEEFEEIVKAIEVDIQPAIIVTTPPSLVNVLRALEREATDANTFAEAIADNIDLLVIDEAHHASAPTYKETIKRIREYQNSNESESNMALIGLTATPFRGRVDIDSAAAALQEIFGELLWPKGTLERKENSIDLKKYLQDQEILAIDEYEKIVSEVKIHYDPKAEGSFQDQAKKSIEDSALRHKRREVVTERIKMILQEDPDASILYFGASVQDSLLVANLLQMTGIRAAHLSGESSRPFRRETITRFKDRKLQVLCNCELLTTGFDAPKISHVIIGRPTDSLVLFQQMVGRGLRGPKFGGTRECRIISIQDKLDGVIDIKMGHDLYLEMWGIKLAA